MLIQGIARAEKTPGANKMSVARPLEELSRLYVGDRRFNDALPLLSRLAKLCEGINSQHEKTAYTLTYLAAVHAVLGHVDEASLLYKRALSIFEQRNQSMPTDRNTKAIEALNHLLTENDDKRASKM